jgi:hypothetical protein
MVHRGPEVMYFDGGEVVRVSALHLWDRGFDSKIFKVTNKSWIVKTPIVKVD